MMAEDRRFASTWQLLLDSVEPQGRRDWAGDGLFVLRGRSVVMLQAAPD